MHYPISRSSLACSLTALAATEAIKLFRRVIARSIVVFLLLFAFCAARSAADIVSKPRRLFGLGDVRVITVSSDQRFMATAGQGGAFLWNLQTGALLHRL